MDRLAAGVGAIEAITPEGFRVAGVTSPSIYANVDGAGAWVEADGLPPGDYDLLLLGTGSAFAPVSPTLAAASVERGIVIEAMDSRAAARTYSLLLSEGRRVAVALMALD